MSDDAWQSIGDVAAGIVDKLQAEKMEKARAMRENGVSFGRIMAETGLTLYTLKCELQPGYRQRVTDAVKRSRGRRRKVRTNTAAAPQQEPLGRQHSGERLQVITVPPDVLADRDRRMAMQPRSLTAALLGDPPTADWHKRA